MNPSMGRYWLGVVEMKKRPVCEPETAVGGKCGAVLL